MTCRLAEYAGGGDPGCSPNGGEHDIPFRQQVYCGSVPGSRRRSGHLLKGIPRLAVPLDLPPHTIGVANGGHSPPEFFGEVVAPRWIPVAQLANDQRGVVGGAVIARQVLGREVGD